MLTVPDLINIQYIPEITDISLILMVDFYEQYLCKRFWVFELADGQKVKLFFKDTSEIFHVSGIDHIYGNVPMDGTHFVDGVKNNTIDLLTLENMNKPAFTDYIDRIRSFVCIDTILKNCEYLWFPTGIIEDSKIKVKYLLLKGLDNKNLHLGIDTYKKNRPYFSKTLLVTEGTAVTKYIEKAEDRIRVVKIEIIDKANNTVLETVDRKAAVNKADGEISEMGSKWIGEEFHKILKEYTETTKHRSPNSRKKREWVSNLVKYLESNKDSIQNQVSVFDPYWAAKIVSEQIKKYKKESAMKMIEQVLIEHIPD